MAWCSVGGSTGTTLPFTFTYLDFHITYAKTTFNAININIHR
jgi:hypothetical protein